jgi:putative membrane protein
MIRTTQCLGALFITIGISAAFADDKKPATKPFDDAEFVMKAASGGMHEVELGKLASMKAKSDAVKKFADRMVADHTKAGDELKTVAKSIGAMVPEKMNAEHQKEYDRFKNYSGANFDKDYVDHMVKDHEGDVAEFKRVAKEAKSPELRSFAAKTLTVVEDHLKAIKQIQEQMK